MLLQNNSDKDNYLGTRVLELTQPLARYSRVIGTSLTLSCYITLVGYWDK